MNRSTQIIKATVNVILKETKYIVIWDKHISENTWPILFTNANMNKDTPLRQSPTHIDKTSMLCAFFFFKVFNPMVKKKTFTAVVIKANGAIIKPIYPDWTSVVVFVEFDI